MTVPNSTYPFGLGGQSHGKHLTPYQTYLRGAIDRANPKLPRAVAASSRKTAIEDRAIEDAGVRAGEIVGWRAWRLDDADGLLRSIVANNLWVPGEPMTGEVFATHGGVHAFKSIEQATEYGEWFLSDRIALGSVNLWGNVIEHTGGYRGENGAVRSIERIMAPRWSDKYPPKRWWSFWRKPTDHDIKELRARYGLLDVTSKSLEIKGLRFCAVRNAGRLTSPL